MSTKYCYRCMQPLSHGEMVCASCHFDLRAYSKPATAMAPGDELREYVLGVMIASSRQAQCYIAQEKSNAHVVLVEEFYPSTVAGRKADNAEVIPVKETKNYKKAVDLFVSDRTPRSLRFLCAFKANNTAYRVYDFACQQDFAGQAERLLDTPILFREGDRVLMSINALTIPAMPAQRDYRGVGEVKNTKTSTRRKTVLTVAAALAVVAIAAGLGYLYAMNRVPDSEQKHADTPLASPTATLTEAPTSTPTMTPTSTPTATPTSTPTCTPTVTPTSTPTATPTSTPTAAPTSTPTAAPTSTPTAAPTSTPTCAPTEAPTSTPTATPTSAPTCTPAVTPTSTPTAIPTGTPAITANQFSSVMSSAEATATPLPGLKRQANAMETLMPSPTPVETEHQAEDEETDFAEDDDGMKKLFYLAQKEAQERKLLSGDTGDDAPAPTPEVTPQEETISLEQVEKAIYVLTDEVRRNRYKLNGLIEDDEIGWLISKGYLHQGQNDAEQLTQEMRKDIVHAAEEALSARTGLEAGKLLSLDVTELVKVTPIATVTPSAPTVNERQATRTDLSGKQQSSPEPEQTIQERQPESTASATVQPMIIELLTDTFQLIPGQGEYAQSVSWRDQSGRELHASWNWERPEADDVLSEVSLYCAFECPEGYTCCMVVNDQVIRAKEHKEESGDTYTAVIKVKRVELPKALRNVEITLQLALERDAEDGRGEYWLLEERTVTWMKK